MESLPSLFMLSYIGLFSIMDNRKLHKNTLPNKRFGVCCLGAYIWKGTPKTFSVHTSRIKELYTCMRPSKTRVYNGREK